MRTNYNKSTPSRVLDPFIMVSVLPFLVGPLLTRVRSHLGLLEGTALGTKCFVRPAVVNKLPHGFQNSWELIQANRMIIIISTMVMIMPVVAVAASLLFITLASIGAIVIDNSVCGSCLSSLSMNEHCHPESNRIWTYG